MRLLSFQWNNAVRVGAYADKGILDLPSAYMAIYETVEAPNFLYDMKALISNGEPALALAKDLMNRAIRNDYQSFFRNTNS